MNRIRKILLFLKNIWHKQDKVKKLEEPKITVNEDKKESFMESLRITREPKKTKQRITTLTCNGDGLGIQKKITY